ncbi:metal-dependent hydrolase [Halohasta litorea]|uniref:Metal-dependent hydrolase n=1 Tax=Halohasta litorea TaxID=869891 RepID=A0ABD6D6J3_9EURY|nr:metal-dependent hydrolase [Halohasta litorea]
MPPTLLSVAVGVLLGVGLLGAAFDRRSLAVVALAAGLPDADAILAVLGVGAANASLHSAFVAVGAAGLLYYETERRERSWLRAQSGWYGVRVAWVAVAAYAVAGIGLDLFSTDAVALLYPLSDRYYAVVGKLVVSTQEGLVQTYVDIGEGWLGLASPGTVESHTVGSWWTPAGEERRLRLIESGWQAIVVLTAAAAIPAKGLVERGDR